MAVPVTRSARQDLIGRLIRSHRIPSQRELLDHLVDEGVEITQATLLISVLASVLIEDVQS